MRLFRFVAERPTKHLPVGEQEMSYLARQPDCSYFNSEISHIHLDNLQQEAFDESREELLLVARKTP